MTYEEKIDLAAATVRSQTALRPAIGLVLGSGLGAFGDTLEEVTRFSLAEFEGFPVPTLTSHRGHFLVGKREGVPVAVLQQSPESYNDSTADGAAAVIVQQNLAKTHAVNDVTSIVFDFRGYDTMGEAFILITAVAGSSVILFTRKSGKEEKKDDK